MSDSRLPPGSRVILIPWSFGTSGVDLFFVISGFIMVVTTSGTGMRPVQFWRRRVVRVVPRRKPGVGRRLAAP